MNSNRGTNNNNNNYISNNNILGKGLNNEDLEETENNKENNFILHEVLETSKTDRSSDKGKM